MGSKLQDLMLKLKGSSSSGNYGHAGRKGKRGGSAPGNLVGQNLILGASNRAEERFQEELNRMYNLSLAKKQGYTRDQFETAVNELTKDIEEKGQLTISMGQKNALKVAESGEIKGREQVGSSHGTYQNEESQLHRNTFDEAVTKGSNAVYGTYGLDAAPYGKVSFLVNKDLLNSSTVTPGDSIDQIVGGSRLEGNYNNEEVKQIFMSNAYPGSYAPRLVAARALKEEQIMPYLDIDFGNSPSIFDENKTIRQANLQNIAVHMTKEPYVEVQVYPSGTGIPKSSIMGIHHRSLYPGRKFESEEKWKNELKKFFPDTPFKESDNTYLHEFEGKLDA